MATVYRIAKWRETFETADSRRHKVLTWVSMPIGFQSNGYQLLIDQHPADAPSIYGAWCALVSIAAQCPERGLLANSRGEPLSARRMARMAFMPVEPFEKLLAWASRQDVGWLEVASNDDEPADDQPATNQPTNDSETTAERQPIELPNLTKPDQTKPIDASASLSAEPTAEEEFRRVWNGAEGVRACRSWNKKRAAALRERMRETIEFDYGNRPWLDALIIAVGTKFPLPCFNEPGGWRPDADWILRPNSLGKIFEGAYDWSKSARGSPPKSKGEAATENVLARYRQNHGGSGDSGVGGQLALRGPGEGTERGADRSLHRDAGGPDRLAGPPGDA